MAHVFAVRSIGLCVDVAEALHAIRLLAFSSAYVGAVALISPRGVSSPDAVDDYGITQFDHVWLGHRMHCQL
jgi:hypothetical protein